MRQHRLFAETPFVPDLTYYDVILVNSSAGKDSQSMLDEVVRLCDAADVPRSRITVVHANLGRVEWPGVPELAQRQAQHYGLRFETVTRRQGDLLHMVEKRGMWPDAARRYCTSALKRSQVAKLITSLVGEINARRLSPWSRPLARTGLRKVRVLNCMGMRAQESPRRAKKPAFRRDEKASNGRRLVDEWLPIHRWSEDEVWARIGASGVPYHPVYDDGMPRLSCCFCILVSRSALVRAAQLRPDLAREYEQLEARIGHRFTQRLSMREIVAAARSEESPSALETWSG